MQTPSVNSAIDHQRVDPLAIPPEAEATRLIDVYFSETGLLFPFIQENYFRASYNDAKSKRFIGVRRSYLCLLQSMLAMAAHIDDTRGLQEAEKYYRRAFALQIRSDPKLANLETGVCIELVRGIVRLMFVQCKAFSCVFSIARALKSQTIHTCFWAKPFV